MLEAAAGKLCFPTMFAGCRGRAGRNPLFSWLGRAPNEIDKPLIGVFAIALLRSKTACHDDEHPVGGHPPPGNPP